MPVNNPCAWNLQPTCRSRVAHHAPTIMTDGKTRSAQIERILTLVVDDDVAGLAGGVGADHARDRHDLADERVLGLGDVHGHAGLVPVPANQIDKKRTTAQSSLCGIRLSEYEVAAFCM